MAACIPEAMREIGRSERIRTSDPLLPKQVRYQAALRSDRGRRVKRRGGELQGAAIRNLAQAHRVLWQSVQAADRAGRIRIAIPAAMMTAMPNVMRGVSASSKNIAP